MKRLLLPLILLVATVYTATAQDINQLMTDLSKVEGVQHQIIDKEMLQGQLNQAIEADQSGQLKSQMPAFMQKMETVEAIISENTPTDIKEKFDTELANLKDEGGYETLLKVKQDEANIQIIVKKGDETSDVHVFVIADNTIVAVKMTGTFDEQDLMDIVKEQQKNN